MKAIFEVVLGRKESMKTASNMRIDHSHPMSVSCQRLFFIERVRLYVYIFYELYSDGLPGYVWDHYEPTVKMSSYLVAFLVSEFVDVETTTTHRVPFRLWVKQESQHLAGYVRFE